MTNVMNHSGSARATLTAGYDPWGGVTYQELAFAEEFLKELGSEEISNFYDSWFRE